MKWLNLFIKYRLWIGLATLAGAIAVNIYAGFWPSFILYFIAVISILGHFLIGPLRLIQTHIEEGDFDGAKKVLDSIWFPGLLIKPVRSAYYAVKGQLAMVTQNTEEAEKHLKKSLDLGGTMMKDAEGANKLQLGMLALQKGDWKSAGIPDKEGQAMAYFQMCQIYMNKREFRAAKDYFRKTKALKPTTPQLVDQIKQMEKYITRIPG
jgi:tetratricopeptide (TPR) repeat protein